MHVKGGNKDRRRGGKINEVPITVRGPHGRKVVAPTYTKLRGTDHTQFWAPVAFVQYVRNG